MQASLACLQTFLIIIYAFLSHFSVCQNSGRNHGKHGFEGQILILSPENNVLDSFVVQIAKQETSRPPWYLCILLKYVTNTDFLIFVLTFEGVNFTYSGEYS